jgi:hypothetical protein
MPMNLQPAPKSSARAMTPRSLGPPQLRPSDEASMRTMFASGIDGFGRSVVATLLCVLPPQPVDTARLKAIAAARLVVMTLATIPRKAVAGQRTRASC